MRKPLSLILVLTCLLFIACKKEDLNNTNISGLWQLEEIHIVNTKHVMWSKAENEQEYLFINNDNTFNYVIVKKNNIARIIPSVNLGTYQIDKNAIIFSHEIIDELSSAKITRNDGETLHLVNHKYPQYVNVLKRSKTDISPFLPNNAN